MIDNMTRAEQAAREQANKMRRKIESGLTPAQMGWPNMTAEALIESEYQCWLLAEQRT
jgi:hypothetical protein